MAQTIIGENTALTLSLVLTLLACGWSFAFFLTRFVTTEQFEKVVEAIGERLGKIEDKLDAIILRQLDK